MSGYKRATVSISQEEYDRLRESEGKLRSLPAPDEKTLQAIDLQTVQLIESNLADVEERQVRFQQYLTGIDGAIQSMEQNTHARLQEFNNQVATQLQEHIGKLREDYTGLISAQEKRYQEFVLELHRQQQLEISAYAEEMSQFSQEQQQKEIIALAWLNASFDLLDFIRENYATDFFAPGRLALFEQQLVQTEGNSQNGFTDAVLVASQATFRELSVFRLELEQQHTTWQVVYQAAWEGINRELSQVEASFSVPALDLDGNELPYLVDVDFWNPGCLEEIADELSMMGNRMLDQVEPPSIDTFQDWLENALPGLHRRLKEVVLDARIKTINSQLRINVADLVVQALEEQGFSLASSAYNDYDLRNSFGARLTNIEGSEVIVQVSPTGSEIGANELQIQSLDAEVKTEHELRSRWNEISRSLGGYGIQVGSFERLDSPRQRTRKGSLPQERERISPLKLTPKSG